MPLLVFLCSNILIVLISCYSFHFTSSLNWAHILWKSWSAYYHTIFVSGNATIFTILLTHFDFDSVLSHYIPIAIIPILTYCLISFFHVVLTFWKRWKKILIELMNRLFYNIIHQWVWYCWVVTAINPFNCW